MNNYNHEVLVCFGGVLIHFGQVATVFGKNGGKYIQYIKIRLTGVDLSNVYSVLLLICFCF